MLAAVAPAKAVVVHAVLLPRPALPLPGLPHDGQAALHGPAVDSKVGGEVEGAREPPPVKPEGCTYLASERLQLPAGSGRPVERGPRVRPSRLPQLHLLTCLA